VRPEYRGPAANHNQTAFSSLVIVLVLVILIGSSSKAFDHEQEYEHDYEGNRICIFPLPD
jgi:hypothetical protein